MSIDEGLVSEMVIWFLFTALNKVCLDLTICYLRLRRKSIVISDLTTFNFRVIYTEDGMRKDNATPLDSTDMRH